MVFRATIQVFPDMDTRSGELGARLDVLGQAQVRQGAKAHGRACGCARALAGDDHGRTCMRTDVHACKGVTFGAYGLTRGHGDGHRSACESRQAPGSARTSLSAWTRSW
ncbi:hypothetical protein CRG98_012219 [Punica granatum]|uniref:Uncharacterized protein n=1 Tax=Punica granatum TaxID=22663 RepID=A0A2I0KFV3_PUNGR|nr:hypothetical protein CRG98_012219 [Punica granatum]